MEPDPSDLSRKELEQRIAELEAEKKSLQHQRDKAVAEQDAAGAFTPGPLPVIAAVCRESGLVETVNDLVEWDEQQSTLSPGERVMTLIMNVLTEGEPLYRLPEFFEATDTENLFHHGIEPDNLNDDALGRGLDQLAETGLRTVLGTVMWEAASRETHSPRVVHSDTTTVSVQGDYETDDESDQALNITYGHSKDNRGDLKQYTGNSSRRLSG